MLIYKIFRRAEYDAFLVTGQSSGAPVDLADGYVHLSTAEQVRQTAAKHFPGEDGLMLLALESQGLDDLRWEVSRGGAEFPHLYRPLQTADVLWARPLSLTAQGHDFSGLLP